MKKSAIMAALLLGASAMSANALDLSDGVVRIGVLNDQSGTYSVSGGRGSVATQPKSRSPRIDPSKGSRSGWSRPTTRQEHRHRLSAIARDGMRPSRWTRSPT